MLWMPLGIAVAAVAARQLLKNSHSSAPPLKYQKYFPSQTSEYPPEFRVNMRRLSTALETEVDPAIAIIGQPGAGKSSLVFALCGADCEPKPSVGQTTDATDWSRSADLVLITKGAGLSCIDVPGIGTARHGVTDFVALFPFHRVGGVMFVLNGKLRSDDMDVLAHVNGLVRRGTLHSSRFAVVRTYSEVLSPDERNVVQRDLEWAGYSKPLLFMSNRTSVLMPIRIRKNLAQTVAGGQLPYALARATRVATDVEWPSRESPSRSQSCRGLL